MPPNLVPNIMLGGYRLIEQIGKGGFSEVWSAWDTRLNRLVAIKIVLRTEADAFSVIQFGREASVLTHLEHPHVLPLYDYAQTPELRYLVMRYVTGGSLAQRIRQQRLPVAKILQLMLPVAATLDYIHEQHVVHRDLKPGNILLDAGEAPYLADFGLAKQLTDETQPFHSASGTLTYMPPEQFVRGILSASSDLYSFGILLYELFTGELPYKGEVALGMRQLTQNEQLADVTLANPTLPGALNELLRRLTDPDPLRRPASANTIMQQIFKLTHRSLDTEATLPDVRDFTLALESGAYRRREAESLIEQNLPAWVADQFTLSITHFVLLNILLREMETLLTPNLRALMLRGALEYNQEISYWWEKCQPSEQQKACWHAVLQGTEAACLQALRLILNLNVGWIDQATPEVINVAAKRLMPLSEATPIALKFLEQALPLRDTWQMGDMLGVVDDSLCSLALSRSPLAEHAARLVGTKRRTQVMLRLAAPKTPNHPALVAYEAAGSLPPTLPLLNKIRLSGFLALRQLTRQPLLASRQYLWSALGNALALALMIYVVFRAADPANIFEAKRLLNTLGLGLLFGMLYGFGVWLARHLSQRLLVVPAVLRIVLGLAVGSVVLALGFTVFQQLNYQDEIDPMLALRSGFLYVLGFVISIGRPIAAQILLGTAGMAAALLIPWYEYLSNADVRPPFFFDDTQPNSALPLVLVATLLAAVLTFGYVWIDWIRPSHRKDAAHQLTAE